MAQGHNQIHVGPLGLKLLRSQAHDRVGACVTIASARDPDPNPSTDIKQRMIWIRCISQTLVLK